MIITKIQKNPKSAIDLANKWEPYRKAITTLVRLPSNKIPPLATKRLQLMVYTRAAEIVFLNFCCMRIFLRHSLVFHAIEVLLGLDQNS